jgi:hypothetical protein
MPEDTDNVAVDYSQLTFKDRALPLIKRGIYVTPLLPRDKKPFLPNWQLTASGNPKQIEEWDREYPNANVGCVATMGRCYLDDDTGNLRERIEAETGQAFPTTYTVQTSIKKTGLPGFHYYFNTTVRAHICGNQKRGDLFDFQCESKQVVGPYSIHPSGWIYVPVDPKARIVDIPDWLCDWLEKNGQGQIKPELNADEEGSIEPAWLCEALDAYEVKYEEYKDNCFDITCPWMDEHSTGKSAHDTTVSCLKGKLGFSCLHAHCGDRHWRDFRDFYDPKRTLYRFPVEVEEDDWNWMQADDGSEQNIAAPEREVVAQVLNEVEAATKATIEAVQPSEPVDLTMPEDAMYGKLGDAARALGTPFGHAYPAVLVVFSSIPTMDYMCGTRIGIYAAIIAPVGAGKNTSLDRATKFFALERGRDWAITTASSDRGLMQKIGSKTTGKGAKRETVQGPNKLLLRTPEMSATLKKAAIESSTLSDMLCEVWDSGLWECSDKLGTQECDCRLSWAGGVPVSEEDPDSFSALFSKFTSYGLMSRMILGYSPVRFIYRDEIDDHWAPPPVGIGEINLNPIEAFVEALDNSVVGPEVMRWEPEAQRMLHEWKRPLDLDGRIKYNLKKIALLSASANREESVSAKCLAAAIKFMDWQLKLRALFRPSEAIGTPESTLAEIVMRKFRLLSGCAEDRPQILWRKVAHDMKWLRHGPALLKRTIESLVAVGELAWGTKEDADGKKVKDERRVIVRFKQPE